MKIYAPTEEESIKKEDKNESLTKSSTLESGNTDSDGDSKKQDASESEESISDKISGEDNLELAHMKRSQRRKAKRERFKKNTEGMSKAEKFSYFMSYYKWHIILPVLLTVVAFLLIRSIYQNSRPVAISLAVINCRTEEQINYDVLDDYMAFYEYDEDDYQIQTSSYSYLDLETYSKDYNQNPDSANYSQLPNLCYQGYFDVIVADKTGIIYCAAMGYMQPLNSVLYKDVSDIIYGEYEDLVFATENASHVEKDFAIDISDTEFAARLNLDYDDVYLGFVGQTDTNLSNARHLLNYIFDMKLSDDK